MTQIRKISIIGLGLMGGSFALALKHKNPDYFITGYDHSPDSAKEALSAGAIDLAADNLQEAVAGARLVVIALPISSYEQLFSDIGGYLDPDTIVTDLGSVKLPAINSARRLLPGEIVFIGGHPMTGSERSGFRAANPFLYENAYYFLTPKDNTPLDSLQQLEGVIKDLGAYVIHLTPADHDLIVSQISHLPHIIAVTLINFMDRNKGISYLPFVGGGFRDSTRIAAGNPSMWKEILLANKNEIISGINSFQLLLDEFKELMKKGREEHIIRFLENAKLIRDSIPHRGKDYVDQLFEIVVAIEDKPGSIAKLTQLISSNNINIKEIEILHSRQSEGGALRLAFETQEDQQSVLELLQKERLVQHLFSGN